MVDNVTIENIATFEATIVKNGGLAHGDLGCHLILAITTSDTVPGDEDVEEAGSDKCSNDENDNHVHEHETVDEWWVVGVTVEELGVGKRKHQCHSRTGDVLEADGPNPMNLPVLGATEDGTVQVPAQLVALDTTVRYMIEMHWKRNTYRVESRIPEPAEDRVATPESGSRDSWSLAYKGRE